MKEMIKEAVIDIGISCVVILNYLLMMPQTGVFSNLFKYLATQAFLAVI